MIHGIANAHQVCLPRRHQHQPTMDHPVEWRTLFSRESLGCLPVFSRQESDLLLATDTEGQNIFHEVPE